ncbi:hypothetical protein [Nocardia aurea]|uniref:hypothetical protein n=1 Tax=Nocardia aurea TaxID=2144174 RepID=UPI0013007E18|nr:hypothetical protein [Nocardia aurea]
MKKQIALQHGDGNIQNNFWSERRRWLVAICTAILVVVTVSAGVIIWLQQPDHAVAEEHAKETDRDKRDNATPPARAEGVIGPQNSPGSKVSPIAVEMDGDDAPLAAVAQDWPKTGFPVYDPQRPGLLNASLYFKITGQNFTPVQIISLTAKVLERRPPPSGTILTVGSQGVTDAQEIGFDLNAGDVLEAKSIFSGKYTEFDYIKTHAVTLALDETIAFKVDVRADQCDCKFVVNIGFEDGRSLVIDDGGNPFRFITMSNHYDRAYTPMSDPASAGGKMRYRLCAYPEECSRNYLGPYRK